LDEIEATPDLGALIVTGDGDSFCAGLDLKQVPLYDREQQRQTVDSINWLAARLYSFAVPTVAAINGHAIAGGLVIALACDYRVGPSTPCKLGLTEARAGVPFPAIALAIVKAELPTAAARRLTLVARNYGPEEALRDGVLDELQPAKEVLERARAVAVELAALPKVAFACTKRQLRQEVIAANQHLLDTGGDPLLNEWLAAETQGAAAALLAGK
jgi:enoyl-CoA hydratase